MVIWHERACFLCHFLPHFLYILSLGNSYLYDRQLSALFFFAYIFRSDFISISKFLSCDFLTVSLPLATLHLNFSTYKYKNRKIDNFHSLNYIREGTSLWKSLIQCWYLSNSQGRNFFALNQLNVMFQFAGKFIVK